MSDTPRTPQRRVHSRYYDPRTPHFPVEQLCVDARDAEALERELAAAKARIAELEKRGLRQHTDALFALAKECGHSEYSSEPPSTSIRTRIAELEKCAARYRWLVHYYRPDCPVQLVYRGFPHSKAHAWSDAVAAAIDAAMQESKT